LDAKSPEGKENAAAAASATKIRRSDDGQRPLPTRADSNIAAIGGTVSNVGNLSNHAKIITEVLKKYPHLVKNNKNIRLKIMQRSGAQVTPVVPMDGDASKVLVNLFIVIYFSSKFGNNYTVGTSNVPDVCLRGNIDKFYCMLVRVEWMSRMSLILSILL
jgi:hypothetical protein